MSLPTVELEHVGMTIGSMQVLRDVTLRLEKGECLGLVGETGSGKSLTCRILAGLHARIGGTRVHGRVEYEGRNALRFSAKDWRALRGTEIALVPQSSMNALDPVMRVGRQLDETIRAIDPASDPRRRALQLLEQVHMPHAAEVLKLYPHELSGGMRQRVMIALALVGSPSLLLADEPTTALDVTVQRGILELIRELRAQSEMSIVLVTHDLAVVEDIADSVAIMYSGSVVESGPVPAVLKAPAHPYTKALLAARPLVGRKDRRLAAIAGTPPAARVELPGCRYAPRCPYALDRCRESTPNLETIGPDQEAACWRAGEDLA